MVQTAATTRSFPSDPDKPADVDRDFLGAGAGSILAGLFGAFPVNASPPRTGIVSETGGRTQLSGLFAAAIVLALLAFGATLLQHVPNAALGGVLLFVALRIIRVETDRRDLSPVDRRIPPDRGDGRGDHRAADRTRRRRRHRASLLHGIWSTTRARLDSVRSRARTPRSGGRPIRTCRASATRMSPSSACRRRCRSSTPPNFRADVLKVLKASTPKPRLLVLEASGILEIDFTAAQILLDLIRECRKEGVTVAMARLESTRAQRSVRALWDLRRPAEGLHLPQR